MKTAWLPGVLAVLTLAACGGATEETERQLQQDLQKARPPAECAIRCMAPPEGCHYEGAVYSGACEDLTCGTLVCDEGPQCAIRCMAPPEGCHYEGAVYSGACEDLTCGTLVCPVVGPTLGGRE